MKAEPHDPCHTEQGKISSPSTWADDLQRWVIVGAKSTPGIEVSITISPGHVTDVEGDMGTTC